MYLINFKPFLGRKTNRLEFMNEVSVLMTTESLLFYTPMINPKGQNMVGWIVVVSMAISLFVNLIVIINESIRLIKL